MITLNEGQQQAHDQLVNYLTGKDKSKAMWLLKGYAGTGKTTTISSVIQTVQQMYQLRGMAIPGIAVTAPTHKAVSVLRKMSSLGHGVDYATIHSLLGLKESINPNTGKLEFKAENRRGQPPIEQYRILIIDETSMLANELFDMILPYVEDGLKLVMMGDPVQIPPVNETDPIPFIDLKQAKYNIGTMELTEIVRQAADNPILEYAMALRKVYKSGHATAVSKLNGDVGIEVLDVSHDDGRDRVRSILQQHFCSELFAENADHMKVIAWTNNTVNLYNAEIRKLIYGQGELPMIMEGEKLVADEPVIDPMFNTIQLHTNQEVIVERYTIATKTITFQVAPDSIDDDGLRREDFKYYDTTITYEVFTGGGFSQRTGKIHILHEDDIKKFETLLDKQRKHIMSVKDNFRKSTMWKHFFENRKKFAWMKYNYAITAHKSQGSTYTNAMMLDWDISKNRKTEERNRIKYVAATRPKHRLYIVN